VALNRNEGRAARRRIAARIPLRVWASAAVNSGSKAIAPANCFSTCNYGLIILVVDLAQHDG